MPASPERTDERSRRLLALFLGLIALMMTLSAWWWFTPPPATPPIRAESKPLPSIPPEKIAAFLEALERDAAARPRPVSSATMRRAFAHFTPDDDIAALNAHQPEHVKSAGDYVSLLVSETRLATGRGKLIEHAGLLAEIEARYGVDRHVVTAIWGIESNYGASMGERRVPRSLATLAMTDTRRAAFWRNELLAALDILERGDVQAEAMTGSWAGAMGHTQFIPSTYNAHAVDFDGNGRRDIWSLASPADALASTANYLKATGWVAGQRAASEVRLPAGFDAALSGPSGARSWSDWQALGLTVARAEAAEPAGRLAILLPAGINGPAFAVGASFTAILRYNNAVPYALAVAHLADRLAGAPPFAAVWPLDDRGLSRAEREELQTLLGHLGHDVGTIDGIIGTGTRAAIRAFQKAKSLPQDGHPNAALLAVLREARVSAGKSP